jgi:hypothetical protein
MKSKVLARKQQDASVNDPREELKAYLDSPLEEVDDVVVWWGVSLLPSRNSST